MRICWDDNDDGAGFAWYNTEKNNWKVVKGLMTWTAFEERFDKDREKYKLDDKMVVVHFRVGTTGPRNGGATHPFPFVDVTEDNLFTLEYETKGILFHNGTLCAGNALMSDTAMAARDYSPLIPHMFEDDKVDNGLLAILEEVLVAKTCRYVVAYEDTALMLGPWIHDKDTNLHWSNERYVFEKTAKGIAAARQKNNSITNRIGELFEVDLPDRWRTHVHFMQAGVWNWDKWDGRWNTTTDIKNITTNKPLRFYDVNGKLTHEYDPHDKSEIIEQDNYIVCVSCNMEIKDRTWLSHGECPNCGTILEPEDDWADKKEEDGWEDGDIYICPTCDETSMIVDIDETLITSECSKDLSDFTKCGKCECVWGYTYSKQPWVVGYHDTKENQIVEVGEPYSNSVNKGEEAVG